MGVRLKIQWMELQWLEWEKAIEVEKQENLKKVHDPLEAQEMPDDLTWKM